MKNLEYKALYRTYRPTTFDEVRGQEYIVETLQNIIRNQKISHAYLFTGPRGTGKTSVAKIFANTINCLHKEDLLKPCQSCIDNINNTLDIIEMDAASNNGVDEIRELKERIQSLPTSSKYKIYIIDEVHMLSKSAFNALLKTLEEPPHYIIFILATTDPQKIPATILSRVQRFNFRRIKDDVIFDQLKRVLMKENISYQEEALRNIAHLANGGMRDALSMVDQVAVFGMGEIRNSDVESIFGLTSKDNAINLLKAIINQQIDVALKMSHNLLDMGADANILVKTLINIVKDFIIYFKTSDEHLLEILDEFEVKTLDLTLSKSYKILDILVDVLKDLIISENASQTLEIGILKLTSLEGANVANNHIKTEETIVKEVIKPKEEMTIKEKEELISPSKYQIDNDDAYFFKTIENINAKNEKVKYNREHGIENEDAKDDYKNLFQENIWEEEKKNPSFLDKNNNHDSLDTTSLINESTNVINIENESYSDIEKVDETLMSTQEIDLDDNSIYETSQFEEPKNYDRYSYSSSQDFGDIFNMNEGPKISNKNNNQEVKKEVVQRKSDVDVKEIVNLFYLADKQKREAFEKAWIRLEVYENLPEFTKYASLFKETKLITAGENFIVVSSKDEEIIWKLNSYKIEYNFKEFMKRIFSQNLHFFGISKNDFETAKDVWTKQKEMGTKPEIKPLEPVKEASKEDYIRTVFGDKYKG